jgi:hypothetical protein
VTRVPWSLYDSRGNCLDVGTVEAGSDSEALRTVLARPRSDLKPAQWYRVKAGTAVASAAGDEFANVGGQAGVGLDRAASSAADAMRAAETRRQAEGQLREFLKGKAKSRAAEKLLDGIDAKTHKTGRDVFLKHFAGEIMDSLRGSPTMGQGKSCAGCGRPCSGPYRGGMVGGEDVCRDCAVTVLGGATGPGVPDPKAASILREIHRRRLRAAELGGTAGDVARKELAGSQRAYGVGGPAGCSGRIFTAPTPTTVGHVLRLDTVQITQRRDPAFYGYQIEAYGNCGNCGIRAGVPILLSGHDPDPSSAPERIRDELVRRLRSEMSRVPCPALHP